MLADSSADSASTGTPTDTTSQCAHCFTGRDPSTDCMTCLPGMYQPSDRTTECVTVPIYEDKKNACLFSYVSDVNSLDENLKEKKVDSAEPVTLDLYPIALPIELRAQLVRLSCRHSI